MQAWCSARDGVGGDELLATLERSGLDRRESREGVGALEQCGLLLRPAS